MANNSLLENTRDLLAQARGQYTQEQIAAGSDVTLTWLQKFVRGAIPDPGVERVPRVHDFLSERVAANHPDAAA